jgi:Domain of unknown function (DUF4407)
MSVEGFGARPASVGRIRLLWVRLSGQSLELAAQNDEINLYARYGALNFASVTLAAAIGFFFVYLAWAPPSAHQSDIPRLLAACGAGLLVGRAILAMDQFVVASAIATSGVSGVMHRLGNFGARGLATVALVLVGSWTLTPLLANGLVMGYLQSHRHLVPTKSEQLAVSSAQTALNDQKHTLAADQRNLSTGQTELSAEEQGHGPSHIAGCGRACRADTVAVQNAQVQLETDRAQIAPLERALSRAQQAETRDLAAQQAKPIDADVFSRHAALSAIERTNSSVKWLDWLVTFLIGAIDLGPILMKSFSPQSATDEAVLAARLRKHDELEIGREFHRDAAAVGAQRAAPAAAEYQHTAFDTEARLDAETRIKHANDRALRAARLSGLISGGSPRRS